MSIPNHFQFGLISLDEADGILYTESKVYANETMSVMHPIALVANHVRAAHIYNITFSHVRQNFAIAGLLSFVQVLFDLIQIREICGNRRNVMKQFSDFSGDAAV